jgi:cbb3-type cytochrome oxidase subunit 3
MNILTDVMFWREAITVGAFGLFLGICFWAYSKKQIDEFEKAAAIVFIDDDEMSGCPINPMRGEK